MENAIDSTLVQRFSCFQSLNPEQIAVLATRLEEVRLSPHHVLFRQGDPGDAVYMLLRGRILIKLGESTPDERILATLQSGAIFGEMGPLTGEPRTASAVTAIETHLWRISTSTFYQALEHGEAWSTHFLLASARLLGRRVMALNEELVKLAGELHEHSTQPQIRKAVAEIEQLRKRLTTEWTF